MGTNIVGVRTGRSLFFHTSVAIVIVFFWLEWAGYLAHCLTLKCSILPPFHPSTLSFILLHFSLQKMTSEIANGPKRALKSLMGQSILVYRAIVDKINFCHIGSITRYKLLLFTKLNALAILPPKERGKSGKFEEYKSVQLGNKQAE